MIRTRFSKPILIFLPSLALIPISIDIAKGIHLNGLYLIKDFIFSAFTPSLDSLVLRSSFSSIQITISIAILAWIISVFMGIILGIICSKPFALLFNFLSAPTLLIKHLLSFPRSIHELIWGLILLQLFGLSPLVAILAISIPYSALMARVFSDQIDTFDPDLFIAIKQNGSGSWGTLITIIIPKLIPIIQTYGGYRLECAIRGATILGIFGLGGIGTELQLSIYSLQFNEVWTSLWMLAIAILLIENVLEWIQSSKIYINSMSHIIGVNLIVVTMLSIISLISLSQIDINIFSGFSFHNIELGSTQDIRLAYKSLPWMKLITETCEVTLLASAISIGLPPILLMLSPTKLGGNFLNIFLLIFRLIPPPLSAFILLLFSNPSIYVAALSLGISNIGVMGKILKNSLRKQDHSLYNAIKQTGADSTSSYLYGLLSPQVNSYLAYSAYRADVILRETALVGVVGGIGLGWQLQESLSSFAWAEITLITATFSLITLIGELISERLQRYFLGETKMQSNFCQSKN